MLNIRGYWRYPKICARKWMSTYQYSWSETFVQIHFKFDSLDFFEKCHFFQKKWLINIYSTFQNHNSLRKNDNTFLCKYSVCGLKFEISEYPIKLLYVTYSPYKYELKRMKTHEIRAKYFGAVFNSVHCTSILFNITAHKPDFVPT